METTPELTWDDETDADDGQAGGRLRASDLFVPLLALYAFLPIGMGLQLCRLTPGARSLVPYAAFSLSLRAALYGLGIQAFLVWPIAAWVYPQTKALSKYTRVLLVIGLLGLPLASFAYYLGAVKDPMDAMEIGLAILPPLVIGALLFEHARKTWVFSLVLGLGSFISLFVFADSLGPFTAAWNYSSTAARFYYLRTVFPLCAMWLTLRTIRVRSEESLADFHAFLYGLGILSAAGLLLHGVLPLALVLYHGDAKGETLGWAFDWLAYLPILFLLTRRSTLVYFFLLGISCVQAVLLVTYLMESVRYPMVNFLGLSWFLYQLCAATLFLSLGTRLLRKPARAVFTQSRR